MIIKVSLEEAKQAVMEKYTHSEYAGQVNVEIDIEIENFDRKSYKNSARIRVQYILEIIRQLKSEGNFSRVRTTFIWLIWSSMPMACSLLEAKNAVEHEYEYAMKWFTEHNNTFDGIPAKVN